MNRTKKEDVVDFVRNQFDRANFTIVAGYKGLAMSQLTELRSELRKANGSFRVVKNTLARRALQGHEAEALAEHLRGPVGIVFAYGDPAAAAKAVKEFAKGAKGFEVSVGFIEGSVLTASGVEQIADLPSREELLAKLVGSMNRPISGVVNVLAGPLRNLVYALSAVAEKKAA
ncbi:MAG: 50S ribosomal protein L10 [Nitrospirota bacterium]|nr:50S ribosomal protein L10 [Nitrospirota bacterium]